MLILINCLPHILYSLMQNYFPEVASFPTTYLSSLSLIGFYLPCNGIKLYIDFCVNNIQKNHVK